MFSLVLPAAVLVAVPMVVESHFSVEIDPLSIAGILFVMAGLACIVLTISMFIRFGRGTLAPWDPTKKLVVTGPYRYTRNPMITGVLTCLLGESCLFHSFPILAWALVFFLVNTTYFILSEEPGLEKRFGDEYLEYKKNVPRWIPRLKPWDSRRQQPTG